MSDGNKGMFFNDMWSTEPLTWQQRLRLRGRMTQCSLTRELACLGAGLAGGTLIFCSLLLVGADLQTGDISIRWAATGWVACVIWAAVWVSRPSAPDRNKRCRDKLVMQGTLFLADHPAVRMMRPAVRGVWRANTSHKSEISQAISEFTEKWHQYERKHGKNWYLKSEYQDEWQVLIATGESDPVGRLDKLCPPSGLVAGYIRIVYHDDAQCESRMVERSIASCEDSLANLHGQALALDAQLQGLRQQQVFLLEVTCPQP